MTLVALYANAVAYRAGGIVRQIVPGLLAVAA